MCSHLRNLASAVDQYSSSRPASLIFDPTSECNLNKFFSSFESASRIAREKENSGVDIRKRDVEACVQTPSIPAGRCVGAVWVAYWACQRYHPLCLSQQATSYMGFLELKKCFFKRGCFGCGDFFWCSDWHEIVSALIDAGLNVMPHTTSHRSLLSVVRSSSSRRCLARIRTRRVL